MSTATREELWAQVQENLDIHVRLAAIVQGRITEQIRAFDTTREGCAALYAAALVTLVQRGAEVTPAPEEPTGSVLWRWLLSLFRHRPTPAALDLVADEVRNDMAVHFAQASDWYRRAGDPVESTTDPTAVTFIALNLYLNPRVSDRDHAVRLLGAALLACTAVWED